MFRMIILTVGFSIFGIGAVELLMENGQYVDPKYSKSREFKVGDLVFYSDSAVARCGDTTFEPLTSIPWPCNIGKIEGDELWLSAGYIHKNDVMSLQQYFDYCNEVIEKDPTQWTAWRGRGICWKHKGEPGKGLKDFDQAIVLNPNAATAFGDRGDIKLALLDYKGAIEDYNQAIRMSPKNTLPFLYLHRGAAKIEAGQPFAAVADFDKSIRLNPNIPVAYYDRGRAKQRLGITSDALKDYDQAIKLDASYRNAYVRRAKIKTKQKDFDGAIADYNAAIGVGPATATMLIDRGWLFHREGSYAKAIDDYTRAIELDETSYIASGNLAFLLATCPDPNLRDGVKAVKCCDDALYLNPNYAYALSAKACGLALMGQFEKAIELEAKALRNTNYLKDKNFDGGSQSLKRIAAWKEKKQWIATPLEIESAPPEEAPVRPKRKPKPKPKAEPEFDNFLRT